MIKKSFLILSCGFIFLLSQASVSFAERGKLLERLKERRQQQKELNAGDLHSKKGLYVTGTGTNKEFEIADRSFILYTPKTMNPNKKMPLMVVLHGGMGNAHQIQKYIGLEPYADKNGFLIAYINGTQVARLLSQKRAGWNAGECCGIPQKRNIDDVKFIESAVALIKKNYTIDENNIYGVGHSNGGMMTYRMLCESNLYNKAVIYGASLEMNLQTCPLSKGKSILAIHGAKDENVPLGGGYPEKGFNHETNYHSQNDTIDVFRKSGANYTHLILPNADHSPESINKDLWESENMSLPHKIISFLGLK